MSAAGNDIEADGSFGSKNVGGSGRTIVPFVAPNIIDRGKVSV